MTVKELIAKLQTLPQDAEVFTEALPHFGILEPVALMAVELVKFDDGFGDPVNYVELKH